MNIREKEKALAKLMGWETGDDHSTDRIFILTGSLNYSTEIGVYGSFDPWLCPYSNNADGLAQVAAVLLKFPTVTERFHRYDETDKCCKSILRWHPPENLQPTQENILDAVLKMKGVIE